MISSRRHLESPLTALDARPRTLRRDGCGDWNHPRRSGHVLADRQAFLLRVDTGKSAPPLGEYQDAVSHLPRSIRLR